MRRETDRYEKWAMRRKANRLYTQSSQGPFSWVVFRLLARFCDWQVQRALRNPQENEVRP